MSARHILTAAALALLGSTAAHAAQITWTTGPSFGGADGHEGILTNGTLVAAIDLGATGTDIGKTITVDPTGLNLTFTRVDSPVFSEAFGDSYFGTPSNIGDAGWKAVIDTAEYGGNIGKPLSAPSFLSGLTVGQTYQVQFFSGRSYPGLDNRLLRYGDGLGNYSPTVSMGQNVFTSMVGTFVASATTQQIDFHENTNYPTLNAYVLRDVSPIPEPASALLLLGGLAALGRVVQRRRGRGAGRP